MCARVMPYCHGTHMMCHDNICNAILCAMTIYCVPYCHGTQNVWVMPLSARNCTHVNLQFYTCERTRAWVMSHI